MIYHRQELYLKSPLSFWRHFEQEERVWFYNPLKKELIIGARRLRTFKAGESLLQFPYVFSTRSFFPMTEDQKWAGLGNETIAFEFYFVEKDGKQTFYYSKEAIDIPDKEFTAQKHVYEIMKDDYGQWQELFNNVKQEIAVGKVKKVVISREVKIVCETDVSIASVLNNLMEKNQNSFIFAYSKEGKTFLGATPEILVQKDNEQIISYALAGTISRGDKEHDEKQKAALLNDPKNRHEHQIVVDYIADVMRRYSDEVSIGETTILTLKNLHHLQTRIKAKESENCALTEWVSRLHPTPALGGYPVQEALAIIRRFEKHERGLYAAPIGIMDEQGNGLFVVGIRSALIEGNRVYAYAGCGIVNDSDCEEEYRETENKVRTIVESL